MRLRRAVLADAPRLAIAHVKSWQGGYRGVLPQDFLDALAPARWMPRWEQDLVHTAWPRRGTIVVEDGDELLGFARLCPTRDDDDDSDVVGEVSGIYVVPGVWRQGVGRQLMTAALDALREAGFVRASLWVLSTNVRAIRFYEATGWQPDGAVKAAEIGGQPIEELRYRHSLT